MDEQSIIPADFSPGAKYRTRFLKNAYDDIESLPDGWSTVAPRMGMTEEDLRAWITDLPPEASPDQIFTLGVAAFWAKNRGAGQLSHTLFGGSADPRSNAKPDLDAISETPECQAYMTELLSRST